MAPGVDDLVVFRKWCDEREHCCEAVACAVVRMLRLLQAAGDCPSLRETLQTAQELDRAVPLPLQSLLNALSC